MRKKESMKKQTTKKKDDLPNQSAPFRRAPA